MYYKREGKDFIYAIITISTTVQQWQYKSGGFKPLFRPSNLADCSAYIKASLLNALQICAGFKYIKKFPLLLYIS